MVEPILLLSISRPRLPHVACTNNQREWRLGLARRLPGSLAACLAAPVLFRSGPGRETGARSARAVAALLVSRIDRHPVSDLRRDSLFDGIS